MMAAPQQLMTIVLPQPMMMEGHPQMMGAPSMMAPPQMIVTPVQPQTYYQ